MSEDTDIIVRKQWKKSKILWVYGLISGSILGVAHSVTPMLVSPETFNFGTGLTKLLEVMGASAILGALTYLAKSPLPALPKDFENQTEITVSSNKPTTIEVTSTESPKNEIPKPNVPKLS